MLSAVPAKVTKMQQGDSFIAQEHVHDPCDLAIASRPNFSSYDKHSCGHCPGEES
jgi:hypothetical protein